ncbi:DUF3073 domain-containing protein [Mycobacterium sp. CBMA293]|uniref:DUF3073 domain-containing protein n=1 Tax=unclassified Mycolicibacterium TaxID=2636767 RepID=UPI0012DEBF24|nr:MULTISPECIES: DUF3073 domain-containing protein [unclassified Mycolicibacterium]MUL47669.1 DUF3073 domain-containing protein [Mycolicibacterium sp. CBMA 360]MUL61813.1 DUF3073 domain-containing protein [Mycolicibacterium sp. CBMA 335]MUL70877.1 DUF3073 domain-containing protein [Mycolicibacterium sp. CBMA 311]MUL92897.1 DUF3073 domain-containing protein [Mycolicibacterium sp. CBMA 230]MUM08662.1 hypothetical protein [Mycolicibacterium sp. CBMA 213]
MGRGRAKAKQTKVARDLKYSSPQTDFGRLQRELSNDSVGYSTSAIENDLDDDDSDNEPAGRWTVPEDDWRH